MHNLLVRCASVKPPCRLLLTDSHSLLMQAVIGAGAAGLVTARELRREGHSVTVYEQSANVGGIWDFHEECEDEDLLGRNPKRRRVHSSM